MLRSIWNKRVYQSVALEAVHIIAFKAWRLKSQHIQYKACQSCLS
jgi:hypothetical protein